MGSSQFHLAYPSKARKKKNVQCTPHYCRIKFRGQLLLLENKNPYRKSLSGTITKQQTEEAEKKAIKECKTKQNAFFHKKT